jgi:hypothetical protein
MSYLENLNNEWNKVAVWQTTVMYSGLSLLVVTTCVVLTTLMQLHLTAMCHETKQTIS